MSKYRREGLRIDNDGTIETWQKVKSDRKGRKRVEGTGEEAVCGEEVKPQEIVLFPVPRRRASFRVV